MKLMEPITETTEDGTHTGIIAKILLRNTHV